MIHALDVFFFFFFLPVFTVTGKLKAHGSSQACFEFSDPSPASKGLNGSSTYFWARWRLRGWVRLVGPMAAEGQGCSEGASAAPAGSTQPTRGPAGRACRPALLQAGPWQSEAHVPLRCFRPKINYAGATGLLEAAGPGLFSFLGPCSHGAAESKPNALGRQPRSRPGGE